MNSCWIFSPYIDQSACTLFTDVSYLKKNDFIGEQVLKQKSSKIFLFPSFKIKLDLIFHENTMKTDDCNSGFPRYYRHHFILYVCQLHFRWKSLCRWSKLEFVVYNGRKRRINHYYNKTQSTRAREWQIAVPMPCDVMQGGVERNWVFPITFEKSS